MDSSGVIERVERLCATRLLIPAAAATVVDLQDRLGDVRDLRAWLDRTEADIVRALRPAVSFPEASIAEQSRGSLNGATKTIERADTLDAAPSLADALDDAAITAGHVDALTRATKGLDAEQRTALIDVADTLADIAAHSTIEQFQRRLGLERKRLLANDGIDRLEQQRRNTSMRTWVDDDGMWNVRGRFDPVTGIRLASILDTAIETLFAETVPECCPPDARAKQDFLRAHAFARLISASGVGVGPRRPEYVVVIDADAPHQPGPVAHHSIPVELPPSVLASLSSDADVHGIVIRNGIVLHAPGRIDLGRSTRLANAAQRRALRALYTTCAIPGCSTHFDRCKIHHIIWWEHGGPTDLDNLLPLCTRHHSNVHHDEWTLTLGAHRGLTLRLPDGTIRSTGPPRVTAA
ncbi:MAG: HNH endonuclease signature motif containing protein [Ilumatobacter sp.]|uniref:HNH endonuclease signature motif containing protein n=1 Tax=Ilumatobacter sp. TaxID=1967498 RepID=UPI00391B02E3